MPNNLQAILEAAFDLREQHSSDQEYNHSLRRAFKEHERLRAEREAHVPEPEPSLITQWPTGEKRITVEAAAWLLQVHCLSSLNTKPNDSVVRREIIKNTKSLACRKFEELILHWAREGRIALIDPILEIPIARPPNPDRYWLIELGAFETIKNALRNGREPAVLPEPAAIDAPVPQGNMPVSNELRPSLAERIRVEAANKTSTRNQAVTDGPGKNDLNPAGNARIAEALTQAYDEAGDERPNINKIVKPVQEILRKQGHRASKKSIQEVADRPEYKNRRWSVGVKRGVKQKDSPK